MENRFFVYGIAGLQLIPVFALTYLQNELSKGSIALLINKSKLLHQAAMLFSFCLLFLHTLSIGPAISIAISILLIMALSISITYTYHEYTLDEGRTGASSRSFIVTSGMFLQVSISPFLISSSTHVWSSSSVRLRIHSEWFNVLPCRWCWFLLWFGTSFSRLLSILASNYTPVFSITSHFSDSWLQQAT